MAPAQLRNPEHVHLPPADMPFPESANYRNWCQDKHILYSQASKTMDKFYIFTFKSKDTCPASSVSQTRCEEVELMKQVGFSIAWMSKRSNESESHSLLCKTRGYKGHSVRKEEESVNCRM